jgi:pimeloyl-ACP methyl ester carboxylesterase
MTISPITAAERAQVDAANAAEQPTVVLVHGLWLLPSSWDSWRDYFAAKGFSTVVPSWPGDPDTVAEARRHPEVLAENGVQSITDHIAAVISALDAKPAIVGHSFGGLITQKLAGMGLSSASVAIDPAPFKGVLPLPLSTLKSSLPVLGNPGNRKKAITLTYKQFRYGWANALPEKEAKQLYEEFHVAAPGRPLFQAAFANYAVRSEAAVDYKTAKRGPLKLLSGGADHTVPWALTNSAFKKQRKNASVTEIEEVPDRGHSLTIDHGWEQVAGLSHAFVSRNMSREQTQRS